MVYNNNNNNNNNNDNNDNNNIGGAPRLEALGLQPEAQVGGHGVQAEGAARHLCSISIRVNAIVSICLMLLTSMKFVTSSSSRSIVILSSANVPPDTCPWGTARMNG